MNKITILTTSPSLSVINNVSGIANMTRLWVENNDEIDYLVFTAGKKDKKRRDALWLFGQITILVKFFNVVLTKKNIKIVHINMPLEKLAIFREFCFILITSLFKKPLIVHLRGGNYNLKKNTPKVIRILIKLSLQRASKIIVLGEKEKSFYSNEYGVDELKIFTLPNSVKVNMIENVKMNIECNRRGPLYILFLGRLDKDKGLEEIVRSLTSIKVDFSLKIAGDGSDKKWFLDLCESKLRNKYEYIGIVSGKKKENVFLESHIFLLPSYYEGLPNALLEAMSYGVVPVVTPVGSIPDVVSNNYNGIIVPVKDYRNISKALIKLSMSPLLFSKLSKNARHTILEKYSLSNYLITMNKVYKDLISC